MGQQTNNRSLGFRARYSAANFYQDPSRSRRASDESNESFERGRVRRNERRGRFNGDDRRSGSRHASIESTNRKGGSSENAKKEPVAPKEVKISNDDSNAPKAEEVKTSKDQIVKKQTEEVISKEVKKEIIEVSEAADQSKDSSFDTSAEMQAENTDDAEGRKESFESSVVDAVEKDQNEKPEISETPEKQPENLLNDEKSAGVAAPPKSVRKRKRNLSQGKTPKPRTRSRTLSEKSVDGKTPKPTLKKKKGKAVRKASSESTEGQEKVADEKKPKKAAKKIACKKLDLSETVEMEVAEPEAPVEPEEAQ